MKRIVLVLSLTLLLSSATTVRADSEEVINQNNPDNFLASSGSTVQTPGGFVPAQGAGLNYMILWLLGFRL